MAITEFAILHLPFPTLPPPALHLLTSALETQSAWHATHFPTLPSSPTSRAAAWFSQVEDPSQILTTARWESVAAHWEWIRSAENQAVMAGLDEYIVASDTVLFHVDADIFAPLPAGSGSGSGVGLLESQVVSVGRMFVARGDKGAFAGKFEEVRGVLEEYASPGLVRFGWREDVEEGAAEEEFVIVCGWESVERHMGFAESLGFSKYAEIRAFIARADVKHYKRFL